MRGHDSPRVVGSRQVVSLFVNCEGQVENAEETTTFWTTVGSRIQENADFSDSVDCNSRHYRRTLSAYMVALGILNLAQDLTHESFQTIVINVEARLTQFGTNSMDCQCIPVAQLTASQELRWLEIQSQYLRYKSPYFHLEFAKAVDRVRNDVRVIVVSENSVAVAFLPIQHIASGRIEPVGGRLNDFHGLICDDNFKMDICEILKLADLSTWSFHALSTSNNVPEEYFQEELPSPYIDLSDGYEAYFRKACRHSSTIKRQAQKTRALIRDAGPLRFELSTRDPFLLEHLIALKREKYHRTRAFDVLSVPWCTSLLREVANIHVDGFQGFVSGLWAGDELVASHIGMMNETILHYWFPAFEVEYSKYSPGMILIQETAKAAAAQNIKEIDLSYGPDHFKYKAATKNRIVYKGAIDFSPSRRFLKRQVENLDAAIKRVPFKNHAKRVARKFVPSFGQREYK